jgi:lysophospholipase L1-like esterase
MKSQIDLQPNQTIVFIGDSITDAGRRERAYRPLGYGYVHFAANQLFAKYPELDLKIINKGISGHTIRDLDGRWKRDCLAHKPDILSVLIGINDVWRQHADMLDEAVFPNEYKSTYERLLTQARENSNCQLVLMEPFMFCNDVANPMFSSLQEFINIVHNLAEQFDAVLVPLQEAINDKIKQVPPHKWSGDMVHPDLWAHAWIAQRWLEATKL